VLSVDVVDSALDSTTSSYAPDVLVRVEGRFEWVTTIGLSKTVRTAVGLAKFRGRKVSDMDDTGSDFAPWDASCELCYSFGKLAPATVTARFEGSQVRRWLCDQCLGETRQYVVIFEVI
jgi:hypothetical protein